MPLAFTVIVVSVTVPVLVHWSLQVAMETVFVPLQVPDLSHLVPWHRLVLLFGALRCVGNLCKAGQDLAAGTLHEAISLPWDLATCQGSL